ncbi:hypothetical protein C5D44_17305 [Rathayibacter sp. AY1B5]|nr:hypothetical protein C5D44_17305 [Rathayibacter sp. AY1B5]
MVLSLSSRRSGLVAVSEPVERGVGARRDRCSSSCAPAPGGGEEVAEEAASAYHPDAAGVRGRPMPSACAVPLRPPAVRFRT